MDNIRHGVDLSSEFMRFREMWDERAKSKTEHTAKMWDERAVDWINEANEVGGAKSVAQRVKTAAKYLRMRGLLQENDIVADIGCGLGLFAIEFAKTAKQAVGIDFSERFVEHGKKLAANSGISNASFIKHDLLTLDVGASGFKKAFDLVFTSITPAITADGVLEKLMEMSRAMCCNVSFVHVEDSLVKRVSRELYDCKVSQRRDGTGFYTMLNLLFLSGYYPETYYYTTETDEPVSPSLELAMDIAFNLRLDSDKDVDLILSHLEKIGETDRHIISRFGSILWDTRMCNKR